MIEYDISVSFINGTIDPTVINLVQNDYNSIKLNFDFDLDGNIILFKVLYPNSEIYTAEAIDNSIILGKGVLSQKGLYKVELSLYNEDSCLTNYAVFSIDVRNDLVDTDEVVSVDDRVPILSNLISDTYKAIDDLHEKIEDGYLKGDKGDTGPVGPVGPAGRDGYKQYIAGSNITIVGNTINAIQPDLTNYATKTYVNDAIASAIGNALEGSY